MTEPNDDTKSELPNIAEWVDNMPTEMRRVWDRIFPVDMPTGDADWLRTLLKEQLGRNGEIDQESFFSQALLGFYDAMWEGMNVTAGHIVYRLSDSVPRERREAMMIYPSSNGSIITENGNWDSLEDWRKQWEKYHPHIPEFIKLLPSGDLMYDLSVQTPKKP